jgi:hypothetical protein
MTTKPPTELFDGPVCDRRYPVADYVQSFEFAQFLDLVVEPPPPEDNALMARSYQPPMNLVLVGDAATIEHAAARAAADGSSLAAALGGVLLGQARAGERGLTLATAPVAAEAVEFTPADLRRGDAGLAAVVKRRTGLSLGPEALATLRAGGLTLTAAGEAGLRSLSLRPKPLTPRPRPPVDQKGGPELRMASSAMMASGASSDGPEIEASFASERPGLQLAAVVPWVQRWKLLGYSRGKLVQSLTLAPQEETTIEVFTWDRQRRTLDQTSQTDVESSSESDFKRQDSLDTLNELLTGNELNREVGAQFAASYGTSERTYVKLDGQGKLSAKDSVNRTARQTGKRLSDMTAKASSRVKTQRSSKITEASEFGSETRVTRKIRNANMCRTLSFDYFELMVSYEVETEPDPEGVVLCMMVTNPFAQEGNPLEIPVFEDRHLRIYDSLLRPALLNGGLAAGFDGARLLSAREHAKAIACETYGCGKKAEAEGDDRSGELDTYKPPAYTTLPAWSTVVETGTALAAVAEALFNARAGGFFDGYTPDNRGGASAEGVAELKRFMFARLLYRLMAQLAGALDSLKGFTANPPTDPEALRDALRRVALNAPSGAGSGSAEALQPVLAAPPSSIEAIATEALAAYPEGRRGFLRGKADYWNAWSPNDGGLAPPSVSRSPTRSRTSSFLRAGDGQR